MYIDAFIKGLRTNPFNESLIRNKATSMAKIRNQVVTHIEVEETMRSQRVEERQQKRVYKENRHS